MPRAKKIDQKSKIIPTKSGQKSKVSIRQTQVPEMIEGQVKSKKLITKTKKTNSLSIDLFDTKGKVVKSVDLPKEIFGAKINDKLMTQAVRIYLANQRKGTASTKDRGEVHGSTRKIYRQKGTGRARHGSRKAPIFVHGGIVSGPHPRDFSLKMPKKMKRLALFSALSAKIKDNEIKVVTGLETLMPKTKLMVEVIKNLGINGEKRNVLMVVPAKSAKEPENVYRAARNIEGISIINAAMLNAYEVLNNKLILLMDSALNTIKENFLKEQSH